MVVKDLIYYDRKSYLKVVKISDATDPQKEYHYENAYEASIDVTGFVKYFIKYIEYVDAFEGEINTVDYDFEDEALIVIVNKKERYKAIFKNLPRSIIETNWKRYIERACYEFNSDFCDELYRMIRYEYNTGLHYFDKNDHMIMYTLTECKEIFNELVDYYNLFADMVSLKKMRGKFKKANI